MTTIKLNDQEFELKFTFKSHKLLQKAIKDSGKEAVEYLNEDNYPTIVKVSLLDNKPDATIEEIELAFEELNHPQIMELVGPYLKYYTPNVQLPTA